MTVRGAGQRSNLPRECAEIGHVPPPTHLLLALALAAAPTSPAPELAPFSPAEALAKAKKKPLPAEEISRRVAAGGERYVEKPLSELKDVPEAKLADALWPRRQEQLPFPIVAPGGALASMPMDEAALAKIEQGEALFREAKYEEAAVLYHQALKDCPRCYLALLQLGEVSRFTNDLPGALRDYDEAARVNPLDYRPHFYKGLALSQHGRAKQAVEAWVTALALYPRNPILLDLLRKNAEKLGVVVLPDALQPRAFTRRRGDVVELYADTTRGAYWLTYARCKALWLGDAEHRREVTGLDAHRFTAAEELECLTALVESYQASKSEDAFWDDPHVERIARALKEKRGMELVLYELASRVSPHITLSLAKGERAALERFITRFEITR